MKEILYFSSTSCVPCQTLSPIVESLSNQINYRKIDVNQNPDMSIKYGIRNIPTLVLVENGEVKGKIVGIHSKENILNFYNN